MFNHTRLLCESMLMQIIFLELALCQWGPCIKHVKVEDMGRTCWNTNNLAVENLLQCLAERA